MEFEIEEWALEAWVTDESEAGGPNHAPGWFSDGCGQSQTGVWIPEEGRALTAKRLVAVD